MSEPPRIPPGYKPLPGGGMQLIDPTDCPGCGRYRFGQRGYAPCASHRGHPTWTCACGQLLYGVAGRFVTELRCR